LSGIRRDQLEEREKYKEHTIRNQTIHKGRGKDTSEGILQLVQQRIIELPYRTDPLAHVLALVSNKTAIKTVDQRGTKIGERISRKVVYAPLIDIMTLRTSMLRWGRIASSCGAT
jgi:hypothetical protein